MPARYYARHLGHPLELSRGNLDELLPGDVVCFVTSNSPYYAATGLLRPAESGEAEVIDVSQAHRRVLAKITTGMVQTRLHKLRFLMVVELGFDYITGVSRPKESGNGKDYWRPGGQVSSCELRPDACDDSQ